jgi:site-specific DNA-cytosine methylase
MNFFRFKKKNKKILQFEFEVWGPYELAMYRVIAEKLEALGHKVSFYLVDEKDIGNCFNRERYEKVIKPLNLAQFTYKRNFDADVYVNLQPPPAAYKGYKIKICYATNFYTATRLFYTQNGTTRLRWLFGTRALF